MGFRIQGSGSRLPKQLLGAVDALSRVWGLGFRVYLDKHEDERFRVLGLGSRVYLDKHEDGRFQTLLH